MIGRLLLPPFPYVISVSLFADHTIPIAVAIFAFGVAGVIVAQFHAPPQFRPLNVLRSIFDSFRRSRDTNHHRRAEEEAAADQHRLRPCWQCHQPGPFRTESRTKTRPTGTLLVECLVIIFIIAPLTLFLGLLLLPLLLIGNPKEKIQICQNCGAERPY